MTKTLNVRSLYTMGEATQLFSIVKIRSLITTLQAKKLFNIVKTRSLFTTAEFKRLLSVPKVQSLRAIEEEPSTILLRTSQKSKLLKVLSVRTTQNTRTTSTSAETCQFTTLRARSACTTRPARTPRISVNGSGLFRILKARSGSMTPTALSACTSVRVETIANLPTARGLCCLLRAPATHESLKFLRF